MKTSHSRRRRGFTLIEVLMVLVILVIIMGLAMGSYSNYLYRARINSAKTQIGLFKLPLEGYKMDVGSYPLTNQGLEALISPPADLPDPSAWGPNSYMESSTIPLDPWGRPYSYLCPGNNNPNSYDLWSSGPDTIDGNEDDINNWTPTR
jgi:general secretion pathway protein G